VQQSVSQPVTARDRSDGVLAKASTCHDF